MENVIEISPEARLVEIRRQHEQFSRAGYDGHNRRPIRTTMRRLSKRRARRREQRLLSGLARWWSFARITQGQEVN